ncbi:MAG TPA: type II toxin-antitoxin system RelE/ParE family toxin [Micromonosporaceae bacterium]|nr:type II toxin-antitoxin system RelE/ParE family toxin [Micromonosporaceae bacterium]
MSNWQILLVEEVADWFVDLTKNDPGTADLVEDAVDRLAADGPALGRPLVDRISGSRHHNMKELRPGSTGSSEVRILFAFDPVRRAVLLVAGDKSGNWRGWYHTAIPLADDRYDAHLDELETRTYE